MGNFNIRKKPSKEEMLKLELEKKLKEKAELLKEKERLQKEIIRISVEKKNLTDQILKQLINSWNVEKYSGSLLNVSTTNCFNLEELQTKLKQVGIRVYFEIKQGDLIHYSYGPPMRSYYLDYTLCDDSKPKVYLI